MGAGAGFGIEAFPNSKLESVITTSGLALYDVAVNCTFPKR